MLPDHFPNCDLVADLGLSYSDANTAILKTQLWNYSTQDSYGATPGLIFDYYNKKTSDGFTKLRDHPNDWTCLLPSSISIAPQYAYVAMENQTGQSGSAGILSVQDRNNYLFTLTPASLDCDGKPVESLLVTEVNGFFHDTNQEGLMAPAGHLEYQNWAQFGLAITYQQTKLPGDKAFIHLPAIKFEYDYTAFNNQYETHTVTLTANVSF